MTCVEEGGAAEGEAMKRDDVQAARRMLVEELCCDPHCKKAGDTHWHRFDLEALKREAQEADMGLGVQYSMTLRVRKRGRIDAVRERGGR
jgi:hypothetical protein